jgi:hypothetical protein
MAHCNLAIGCRQLFYPGDERRPRAGARAWRLRWGVSGTLLAVVIALASRLGRRM